MFYILPATGIDKRPLWELMPIGKMNGYFLKMVSLSSCLRVWVVNS